jgi:predicted ATP-dependent serine protease
MKKITDLHQGIIEGKVYTIGAYSGHGKSTLSYEYASYFVKQKKKVFYFSVEVDSGLLLSYIARNYYRVSHRNIMNREHKINSNDFENLYLYDNVRDLETISKIVMEERPDYVFIDYAQAVRCE